jgi:hypothetical protein
MTQQKSENITIKVNQINELQQNLTPQQTTMLNEFNGAIFHLDLALDSNKELGKATVSLIQNSPNGQGKQTDSASAYLNHDNAILSIKGLIPLMKEMIGSNSLPTRIPYYLTDQNDPNLQQFWMGVAQGEQSGNISKGFFNAFKNIATLIIQSIPAQYFQRPSLNTITFTVDGVGVQNIVDDEIRSAYQHKIAWTNAINEIIKSSAVGTPYYRTASQIFNNPESQVTSMLNSSLQSMMQNVALNPTTFTITKPSLFSNVIQTNTNGSISAQVPSVGSAKISFAMNSSNTMPTLTMPKVNAHNSQSIAQAMGVLNNN